jgi:hypothetical protein
LKIDFKNKTILKTTNGHRIGDENVGVGIFDHKQCATEMAGTQKNGSYIIYNKRKIMFDCVCFLFANYQPQTEKGATNKREISCRTDNVHTYKGKGKMQIIMIII